MKTIIKLAPMPTRGEVDARPSNFTPPQPSPIKGYALPTSRELVDSKRFWWHRLSILCGDFRTAWKGCATSQKNLWVKIGIKGEGEKTFNLGKIILGQNTIVCSES